MHIVSKNVDQALRSVVQKISEDELQTIEQPSRNGKVLRVVRPLTITFTNPLNRVMQNLVRDCNPFFHLFEALWMLVGRNDVAAPVYYNSKFKDYSDDGIIFHGAYGHRWREWFGYDQLKVIIDELKINPESRRCVLQMWDANRFGFDRGQTGQPDLLQAIVMNGKDVPCNLSCTFQMVNGRLDMTVFNRSNDLMWGLLGANVVHFSFLLDYVAGQLGVPIGEQHHVSANAHIYLETNSKFNPLELLEESADHVNAIESFDKLGEVDFEELIRFVAFNSGINQSSPPRWKNLFLALTAQPMMTAFRFHKERNYQYSLLNIKSIKSHAWKQACLNWILKRKNNYEARKQQG